MACEGILYCSLPLHARTNRQLGGARTLPGRPVRQPAEPPARATRAGPEVRGRGRITPTR